MEKGRATRLALLVACTILCYFSLYGPQPLLPLYRHDFAIGIQGAAALITLPFAVLASAPLVYGLLLEAWPPRRVLQAALLVIGLACLAFAAARGYGWLMAARAVQSVALPAAITTIMTLIATGNYTRRMQTALSIYVAANIAGGYLGRLAAGAVAEFLDWRIFFYAVGVLVLGTVFAIHQLPASGPDPQRERPSPRLIARVLADPDARTAYAAIFFVFFAFTTLLSFLPFRLAQLADHESSLQAGYMYSGYLMGIATSLAARPITRAAGGNRRAVLIAAGLFVAGLAVMAVPQTGVMFAVMFLVCAGMFLVHSLLAGHLNERATHLRGLTNGLYVAFYYAGGILGSFLPGLLFQSAGWGALIALACASALVATFFVSRVAWAD
jgi:YNFM family putative membrane transporter